MSKSELEIGALVTHHPAGDERLKELVEQKVFPEKALEPDFRIGMIIDHKGQDGCHWLVYSGDEKIPAWYVTDELALLC